MVARADDSEPVFDHRSDCPGAEFGGCAFRLRALLGIHRAEACLAGLDRNRSCYRKFSGASPADNLLCSVGSAFRHSVPLIFPFFADQAPSHPVAGSSGRDLRSSMG